MRVKAVAGVVLAAAVLGVSACSSGGSSSASPASTTDTAADIAGNSSGANIGGGVFAKCRIDPDGMAYDLSVTVEQTTAIGSITLVSYDSGGHEINSEPVVFNQTLTAGQSITDNNGLPIQYGAASCAIASWTAGQ